MSEKQILAKKAYVDNSLDNVLRNVNDVVSIPNARVELSQKIVTTTEEDPDTHEEVTTDEIVTESYLNKTKLHVEDSYSSKYAEYGINEIVLNESTITGITNNPSGSSSTLAVSQRALSNFKQVEANPVGTPTADLTTIKIDNTIYELDAGTNVEANPLAEPTDELTKLKIDSTVYSISGGGGSVIPDIAPGVTIYEYGKFSGAYAFNTDISVDGDHKIEIVFSTESYTQGRPIFGTTYDDETYRYSYPHIIEWDNKFFYGCGNGSSTTPYSIGKHDFIFNDQGSIIIDGVTASSTYTPVTTSYYYRLGRRESSSSYIFDGKLYDFKLTSNSTGELLHHLVAAKKFGVIGFYDMVTQGFTAFNGMTPGGQSHTSDKYKAELLWEGDWNGSSSLTVPGLSEWLLVAYSNYADDTYLFIGNPDRGGSNYGVWGASTISDIAYRFSFNKTTDTLSVNQNDRGLYFTGGTTYEGSTNCSVKRIYGLIKKPDGNSKYLPNYSTIEQKIGQKWIDGSDIYQITISDTMPAAVTEGTTVLKQINAVSNIDTVISIHAMVYISSHTSYLQLPYITDSNSAGKIQYDITNAKVKLYNSVLNFNNAPIYITLQYTKTAT